MQFIRFLGPGRRPVAVGALVVTAWLLGAASCSTSDADNAADRAVSSPEPGADSPTDSVDSADEVPAWFDPELGGETTARALRGRPFNQVGRSLRVREVSQFFDGSDTFVRHFVTSDGLGPHFNENSCVSCHLDGTDPDAPEIADPGPGPLLRVSNHDLATPRFGTQVQTRAVAPQRAEGRVDVTWEEMTGRYGDGTEYSLRSPRLTIDSAQPADSAQHPDSAQPADTAQPADALQRSLRISAPLIGLGLLEAIPQSTLDDLADPDDSDGDGISGRPNVVTDLIAGGVAVGRLGWKAGQPTVRQQTAVAAANDIGLTNPDLDATCVDESPSCVPVVGPTELSQLVYDNLVFYNRTIAVPIARRPTEPEVRAGARAFESMGCVSCHQPELTTGDDPVEGLRNQTIHPFTDLLLHDMGDGLGDGRAEGVATGNEWRTAPLWGLGLRDDVYEEARYLHDGRARSIAEAILWHGGEADAARDAFASATAAQRRALLRFLGSI